MRTGALILAGGRSERMGQPKELLQFGDESLLRRISTALGTAARPVVVVRRAADQPLPELPSTVTVITDDRPGAGPLAALATGLRHLTGAADFGPDDAAFVTACDSPFLRGADVAWLAGLLAAHDAVIPAPNGELQPTCAVYRCRCLEAAEALLQQSVMAPRELVSALAARTLTTDELRQHDPDLRFLRNVNTPEEYRRALADAAY